MRPIFELRSSREALDESRLNRRSASVYKQCRMHSSLQANVDSSRKSRADISVSFRAPLVYLCRSPTVGLPLSAPLSTSFVHSNIRLPSRPYETCLATNVGCLENTRLCLFTLDPHRCEAGDKRTHKQTHGVFSFDDFWQKKI